LEYRKSIIKVSGGIMARHSEIYKDPQWEKVRQYVIARANGLCEMCKAKGIIKPGREVDHIVELTDGNKRDWDVAYNPDNLQLLCGDCHNDKHDRSIGLQKFIAPVK
jgi:5-methylcytosine-specific restriction endonuclease McrA